LAGIPLGAFALGRLGDIFTMRVAVIVDAGILLAVVVLLVSRGWLNDLNTTKIEDVQESSL
jgi:phosphotransferase system  glucose/maltose/N-acetylglucosamine-specific IIC component